MKFSYEEIVGWAIFLLLGVPVIGMAILGTWALFFALLEDLF
jgi:hypothetical protein